MKNKTANKNLEEIIKRLNIDNGFIQTPDCNKPSYKVKKAWLFGSFSKGKLEPSDIDILIDGDGVGEERRRVGDVEGLTPYERQGIFSQWVRPSYIGFIIKLRKGMKNISIHDYKIESHIDDGEENTTWDDINKTMIEIYPNNRFMVKA